MLFTRLRVSPPPSVLLRRSSGTAANLRRLAHSSPSHPPRKTLRNSLGSFSLISLASLLGYTLGSLSPPPLLTLLSPRPSPPPPDPADPSTQAYLTSLEEALQALPPLVAARSAPDAHEWYETRPYANMPEERRVNSLTAGALSGAGRLGLRPLVRARRDEKESLVIVHVGRGLCGHEGIVHGGLLATVLDEGLARTAIQSLPDKVAVTANLNINYRAPTRSEQFIILKTRLISSEGRKAVVSGVIEDINGNVLVEANATFVQPRYSYLLNKSAIQVVMGEPPATNTPVVEGEVKPVPGFSPPKA